MIRRQIIAVLLSIVALASIFWILSYLPPVNLTAKEFELEQFRQAIWLEYGVVMIIIAMITSVVLIVSLFAMRIAETVETMGEKG
ncbi:MAG: hypothetical protein NDP23_05765 [Crenarchaeota archaeon]|nr:hypothetical protein [Thermoproteota archaeon]